MASTVNTKIIISAFMDNSFGEAMKSLNQFSSIPLAIGRNLMPVTAALTKFGKESLETYASFDDAMRTVEGKLGDVGARQMDALRTQAREWASTTRYHATDVAAALAEAAGSGWSLEEMYQGMPSVLAMAAGGNMDLSAALGYLSTALAGMNLGFDESAQVVDEWMKTASSSRATATDIGESLKVLGSLATLGDSKEEMFTLLAMMAEFGTTGSEAGTLLRNVMMRMVAPTKNAETALARLGVTTEEWEETLADSKYSPTKAAAALKKLALSAYDTEGNLKPITQIVSELRDATADMTEQQKMDILTDIFPQRSIRGILDLMRATDEQYTQMMANISGSGGYAQYMAELQEGGVGGSMRRLESQWEELQIAVGEQLAPIAMGAMQTIGNVLTGISGMDKGNLNILTRSLMGLAGAAPAMMAVGGAMRMISMLGTPGGQLTAAVVLASLAAGAIGGLIDNMEQLDRQRFEANFGTATIDTSMLSAALQQVQSEYAAADAEIAGYVSVVQSATSEYETAMGKLTGGIWTAVATGTVLTESQQQQLLGYGQQVADAIVKGARGETNEGLSLLEQIMTGGTTGDQSQLTAAFAEGGTFAQMGSIMVTGLQDLTADVQAAADGLQSAMKSAFANDNIIDESEWENIQTYMQQMAEFTQMTLDVQTTADYNTALAKGARMGIEGFNEASDMIREVTAGDLASFDALTESGMDIYGRAWAQAWERDGSFFDPTTGETRSVRDLGENWFAEEFAPSWLSEREQLRAKRAAKGDKYTLSLADMLASTSDFGGDWENFSQMVGDPGKWEAARQVFGELGSGTLDDMIAYGELVVNKLGGAEEVRRTIAGLEGAGEYEMAARYRRYLNASEFYNQTSEETHVPAGEEVTASAMQTMGMDAFAPFFDAVKSMADTGVMDMQALGEAANSLTPEQLGALALDYNAMTGGDWASPTIEGLLNLYNQLFGTDLEIPAAEAEPAPAEYTPEPSYMEPAQPEPSETPGRWEADQAAAAMAEAQATMGTAADTGHVAEWGEAWENMALEEATPMDPALMQLSAREMREVMAEEYQATVRLNAEAGTGGGEIGGQMAQQAQQAADSQPVEVPVEEPEVPEPDPVTVPVEPEEPDMALFEQFIKQMQPPPFMIQFALPDGQADGSKYTTDFNGALTPGYQDVNTSDGGSAGSSWASAFQGALDANPGKFTVNVTASGNTKLLEKAESATSQTFANGGRADRASIFGEAGAEWAIPEEHSANTASLLMRAAAASGFTWPELITAAANRTGGGGSGGGDSLTYSPTFIINTDKAEDIEDILRRDKENMRRWWKETRLMEYRMAY